MSTQDNKRVVQRRIDEVINGGNFGVLDDFSASDGVAAIRAWVEPMNQDDAAQYVTLLKPRWVKDGAPMAPFFNHPHWGASAGEVPLCDGCTRCSAFGARARRCRR